MRRTSSLFLAASLVLLISGLSFAMFPRNLNEISAGWPGSHTSYGIPLYIPCLFISALFAFFYAIYNTAGIPFSRCMAQWHFWSSAGGIALFVLGYALLAALGHEFVAAKRTHQPSQVAMVLSALGLTFGPPAFIFGQILFLINLSKALFRLARRRAD